MLLRQKSAIMTVTVIMLLMSISFSDISSQMTDEDQSAKVE